MADRVKIGAYAWERGGNKKKAKAQPSPAPATGGVDYTSYSRSELAKLAKERGIPVVSRNTKAQIITALQASD